MLGLKPSLRPLPRTQFHPAISITDRGLVCGAGSTLVRMAPTRGGRSRLLVEDDSARLLAMLSAAFNRCVSSAEILPHVRAAAEHWSRGEKAVANFCLVFARLPRLRDVADADRLVHAEYVLDHGFPPDALMKELGFAATPFELRRYWEDEPRVPAGFGEQSGRWTNDTQFAPTRVAEDLPPEDEKDYEQRRLTGQTSRQEDLEHGRGDPLKVPELPAGIGPGKFAAEPIPAGPSKSPTAAQQRGIDQNVCSECGTDISGTKSGNMIGNHQLPNALNPPGQQQYYYTRCKPCSPRQGGLVKAFKYRKGN